jgi:hypothetical protein
MENNKAILEILVQTRPEDIVELDCPQGHVRMIPFAGTVGGPLFTGIIEPCGVDTQVTNAADVRHMSARYMLTGKDYTGADCHIYVENNGWFTDGARPRPWYSVPTLMTDSPSLASRLHKSGLKAEGLRDEEGLHIRVFEV